MSNETMLNLNSNFKKSYADKIHDLTPDHVQIVRRASPVPYQSTPGGTYEIPIILARSTGATKAPGDVDIFNLNPPIGMVIKSGQVVGSQFVSRMAFSYEALSRSDNSPNKFESVTKLTVKTHLTDAYFFQECDALYGKHSSGIGTVSAVSPTSITISLASFAPGLWIGNDNKKILIQSALGAVKGTAQLTGIDIENHVLSIDALPAGTVATDIIRWDADGVDGANSFQGLISIASQTSGTLFNIAASQFSLWKPIGAISNGNQPLTFVQILKLMNKPVSRGLGSEIRITDLFVSISTFGALTADEAAKRKYDYSYKSSSAINGTEHIEYYYQGGLLRIIPHHMMKESMALAVPEVEKSIQLVGSQSKPTFNVPGQQKVSGNDAYLFPIPNASGVEARLYYNTSLFPLYPHQMLFIQDILNPALS